MITAGLSDMPNISDFHINFRVEELLGEMQQPKLT